MNRDILRQSAVVLAVIVTLTVNGLANALPLNGQTTGEVSDRFEVYFVPAGYVFSIWGVIYLALLAFAIFQALPSQRENPRLRRVGYPFVLSCVANVAWLFLWHYEVFALTVVAMAALLLLLILIYVRLQIGCGKVPLTEKWLVRVPFSIYLGWITVATIANVTSLLEYVHWSGWGIAAEAWAVIVLLVGVGISWAVSLSRGDVVYLAVIIWAFVGIAVKHQRTTVVATAAWLATGLVVLALAASAILNRRRQTESARETIA